MKTRQGFVSNSSSSSFVINPNKISKQQYNDIRDFLVNECRDSWSFQDDEDAGLITGYTCMDNNYFSDWLEKNGLANVVIFEGGY